MLAEGFASRSLFLNSPLASRLGVSATGNGRVGIRHVAVDGAGDGCYTGA
jgi:hypothetical protein